MTGIDYLPLLFSGEKQIFMLSDHQIAQLLRAMFAYSRAYAQGESPEIEIDDPMVNIVFVGLFGAVRERFDEYRHRCEINRMNALGHGAPKGNQNARKYTEAELQEKREALHNGDFSAAKVLVDAAIQKGIENSNDE